MPRLQWLWYMKNTHEERKLCLIFLSQTIFKEHWEFKRKKIILFNYLKSQQIFNNIDRLIYFSVSVSECNFTPIRTTYISNKVLYKSTMLHNNSQNIIDQICYWKYVEMITKKIRFYEWHNSKIMNRKLFI